MQLPAVHGYGHGGQVGDNYLCPVVGKQLPDYNVGLRINYVDITNNFAMSEICPSFTQGLKNDLFWYGKLSAKIPSSASKQLLLGKTYSRISLVLPK